MRNRLALTVEEAPRADAGANALGGSAFAQTRAALHSHNDIRPERASAPQIFIRLLSGAVGDEAVAQRLLATALHTTDRNTLPEAPRELSVFVRARLLDGLVDELGPRVVAILLQDLESQLRELEAHNPTQSTAAAPTTFIPPSSGQQLTTFAQGDHGRFPSFFAPPREGTSPTSGVTRARPRLPSLAPPQSLSVRVRVAVVDSDRFRRSRMARALVGALCDVVVVDSVDDVYVLDERIHVALVDAMAQNAESVLDALIAANPKLGVVFTYAADAGHADRLAKRPGLRAASVLPRTARVAEVTDQVRRLSSPGRSANQPVLTGGT